MSIKVARFLDDPRVDVEPVLAFVFYAMKQRILVLEHPVEATPSGTAIGPGRVLQNSAVMTLLGQLVGQRKARGLLPAGLMVDDADLLAWWVPGAQRPMWFTGRASAGQPRRLMVPWPSLLFVARGAELSLAALRFARRPKLDDPVFHAPLMNVYADGRLCLGSCIVPSAQGVETIAGWEHAVFDSAFAHTNHDYTLKGRRKSDAISNTRHLQFWIHLQREKARRFPARALKPMGETVRTLLYGQGRPGDE